MSSSEGHQCVERNKLRNFVLADVQCDGGGGWLWHGHLYTGPRHKWFVHSPGDRLVERGMTLESTRW